MTGHTLPAWNPFRQGYRENPSQQLEVLRRENPVHKGINGRWLVLRYDDVKYVLNGAIRWWRRATTSPRNRTLDCGNALLD